MKRILFSILSLIASTIVMAQDSTKMADVMRNNGKIYVVVAVMLVILIGLIIYVARVDRKVTRLERNK